ncbi:MULTISPECIES: translocation/assembly module TamB domain-containing protein [unclassified Halomonas]|uniref:autotransporter assembly complex protein TamB n=1 Tax=unclassified Halomonas TaxID=2609666 RepID=UPI00288655F6|nr:MULTISPECIES: translocation/assembly module TamB domain-containing protein [unclassified Halomonas]MDT0499809.1 translocation/assembly module TamB domain-containing protein [Halomonas sp. PAR7]MDT0510374.1 translocation/assembly module TamB domain-containing protein [Halomonas sp. LES1]MDT0589917.1 translocation/assembly module TamB domain-containing protein [Halomonas sp. PAR8]
MAPTLRHRSRVLSLLWSLFRLLILLPLWLLGLVFLLLGLGLSPWGFGLLLDQGERMGLLEVDAYEGAPLDRLQLEGFAMQVGPASLSLDRLELAWSEEFVLSGRLCLEVLGVEGARLRLADSEPADEPPPSSAGDPLAAIELPFPIELRRLYLEDVEVLLADGTRLSWDHFSTGAVAEGDTLSLLPTRLTGTRLRLPLTPGAQLALAEGERDGPHLTATSIDAAIAVRSPLPDEVAASAEGITAAALEEQPRRELPEITLPLKVEVPELLVEDSAVEGAVEYGVERLALSLFAEGHSVEVRPLEVSTPDGDASLEAAIALTEDYPLELRLESALWLPELMPGLAGQRIELGLDGTLADLLMRLELSGPVDLKLDARADLLDPTLPLTASLASDLVQWPLPGQQTTTNADGVEIAVEPWLVEDLVLRLEGSLVDYRLAASLDAEGPQLPFTRLALTGSGDLTHFAWKPLSLAMNSASVISRGRIDWDDGIGVDARARLDNVDPKPFVEGLSGRLDGDVAVRFRQEDAGWTLAVPELTIDGELQERNLALRAELAGDSEMRWNIETLDFRQGENRLQLAGRVSESDIDLSGEVDMPELASLHDDLSGRISGGLDAAGSLASPSLDLNLVGESLAFAENRLRELRLAGRVSGLEDPAMEATLKLAGLQAGGQRLDEALLALDGRLSEHRLTLEASAPPGMPLSRASLALAAGLDRARGRYAGQLSRLEVDAEQGDLRLVDPAVFTANLDQGSARVQPFCLVRQQGGSLCLVEPLETSPEGGELRLRLAEVPMALLDSFLPQGWAARGNTELDLDAGWGADGSWRAEGSLQSRLALDGQDAYGQPWSLPEARLEGEISADDQAAELTLDLNLAQAGGLALTARVDDPVDEGRLTGRLSLDELRLSPYRDLVTGMETLEGRLTGNVDMAGRLEAPEMRGRIALAGLKASGADVPVEVRDGELSIDLNGTAATIDGYIAAKEGRLNIDGNAAWPSPEQWRADLSLRGVDQPVLAVLPEFGQLRIAPDLEIRARPTLLQVRGDVQVPWARLEVGKLPPSAVAPSPDEVIITREDEERARREAESVTAEAATGEDTAEAMAAAGMALDVQIDLRLGPDMKLSAYGLESGLSGTLEVRQQDGPVQLFGDVNLVDGRFRAYGQDLLIREGQLLFSGPPGQPLLNFEAVRNPDATQDGVVAGLRVTGSAASPQLAVFSEPSMDEASALSYLLRGRAPNDSDTDGALTSALVGLAVGQAGGAVGGIGKAFGVSDLTLDTAGSGEDSQVTLSGQLTDDLEVRYGVGVFSPIAELTLRYNIWRSLYLEAVSGASQAVDLIYTFSRSGNPRILDDN